MRYSIIIIKQEIINQNSDIFSSFIHDSFNKTIEVSKFPNVLKLANLTPIFKKRTTHCEKGNHRPVSILPNLSKICERCF